MTIYFDTETTSLIPGQVCQLSYIIDDGGDIACKNFYFTVDSMDKGVERIHGLSIRLLKELSNGRRFLDDAAEIAGDFLAAEVIVAHNITFDYKFLQKEFQRLGFELKYNNALCTMRYFTPHCKLAGNARNTYKYPKLEELGKFFQIEEMDVKNKLGDLFSMQAKDISYHDARYDATLMYLCCQKAVQNGMICDKIKI